jgi:hypothetical protein
MSVIRRLVRPGLRWPALAGLILLGGCATTTAIREHPEFADQTRKAQKVVLLPPRVQFIRLGYDGDNVRQPVQEKRIAQRLDEAMTSALHARGYVVRPYPAAALGAESRFLLTCVRNAYEPQSRILYAEEEVSLSDAGKFRVALGPLVNPIADAGDADVLLYVSYSGTGKTRTVLAKDWIASTVASVSLKSPVVTDQGGGSMEVALIDGTDGAVLWTYRAANLTMTHASLEHLISEVVAYLPYCRVPAPVDSVEPVARSTSPRTTRPMVNSSQ